MEASRKFGDPLGLLRHGPVARRTERSVPAPQAVHIPPEVRAIAQGKRVLMVGGQGQRPPQREAIKTALELGDLEWITTERGQASPYERLAQRMSGGTYDAVFFVSAFSSHKAMPFIKAARAAGVPVVYLSRGYGVTRVVDEVRRQWAAKDPRPSIAALSA